MELLLIKVFSVRGGSDPGKIAGPFYFWSFDFPFKNRCWKNKKKWMVILFRSIVLVSQSRHRGAR